MTTSRKGRPRATAGEARFNARAGQWISEQRQALGIGLSDLAREVGVVPSTVAAWEQGGGMSAYNWRALRSYFKRERAR